GVGLDELLGLKPAPERHRISTRINRLPVVRLVDRHVKRNAFEVNAGGKVFQDDVCRGTAEPVSNLKVGGFGDLRLQEHLKLQSLEQLVIFQKR
ncbi:hypothetical protein, partial [Cognatilysobacter terrigena]|uniref:hypothetical protein n=1 Tax=Cognatilysobacter terrigena TaxID=2488749 RepID=UPI001AAD15D3